MSWRGVVKQEAGAAAVEFAVVVPLLMTLVMGSIEFGALFFDRQVLTNASREAARYGIVPETVTPAMTWPDANKITAKANAYLKPGGKSMLINYANPSASVSFSPAPVPCTNNANLTVTVTYPYNYLFLHALLPGFASSVTLSATSVMACE